MTILVVTGGRVATVTQEFVGATLDHVHSERAITVLIHGNAKGIDRMCGVWARSNKIHVAVVDALWDAYPISAGPYRNKAMLLLRPDLCVAFPGGRGTAHMRIACSKFNVPVIKVGN